MNEKHKDILRDFLKERSESRVLFYDKIYMKKIDLCLSYEESTSDIIIIGDESDIYDFDEIELIDSRVLDTKL